MNQYVKLEEVVTLEDEEAVIILYDKERRRLVVKVEYDCRTLADWPILYRSGDIGYNHPFRILDETKRAVRDILMQIASESPTLD